MNKIFTVLVVLCATTSLIAQTDDKIGHLIAFAKAYGYVKYFHPSDEAQQIDWDRFAIYGAQEIEKCTTRQEVITTLNELFTPIAPTAKFLGSRPSENLDIDLLTPPEPSAYDLTYWQHLGVSKGMSSASVKIKLYQSIRVNRFLKPVKRSYSRAILNLISIPPEYRDKEIKYSAWVKMSGDGKGTGHLLLRVDQNDGTTKFVDNMSDRPITRKKWEKYEIKTQTTTETKSVLFGAFLKGENQLYLDNISLSYKKDNRWVEIPLASTGFEREDIDAELWDYGRWYASRGSGYQIERTKTASHKGKWSASIQAIDEHTVKKNKKIFDHQLQLGEAVTKKLGKDIFCQIPLVLYGNREHTFPKSNEKQLKRLVSEINRMETDPENLSLRLGNIVNTFNAFQHFYPYFEVVKVNWEQELKSALLKSFEDNSEEDHHRTLEQFTATLRDGHIYVSGPSQAYYTPPITWEWIEGQLVITHVLQNDLGLKVGDVVSSINGLSSKEYFDDIRSTISAATEGRLNFVAKTKSLQGQYGDVITIEVAGNELVLECDHVFRSDIEPVFSRKIGYQQIDEDIFYLDLDSLDMNAINGLMPKLKVSKSIICDLRGYPKGNHDFIRHIISTDDTTKVWMRIPQIVYPDREKIAGYETDNWLLSKKKPDLSDKNIVFITDERAISYAESYMSYIKEYEIATIVGATTAGTNGNVNEFDLPGGYRLGWTGMQVLRHDGAVFHGRGVEPDIYVSKTIDGVKLGRDELLQKAIEVARSQIDQN